MIIQYFSSGLFTLWIWLTWKKRKWGRGGSDDDDGAGDICSTV